jgi:hypothetical protein
MPQRRKSARDGGGKGTGFDYVTQARMPRVEAGARQAVCRDLRGILRVRIQPNIPFTAAYNMVNPHGRCSAVRYAVRRGQQALACIFRGVAATYRDQMAGQSTASAFTRGIEG